MTNQFAALCVQCRSKFTEAEIDGVNACPKCGSTNIPADPNKTHTLTFTDHEWRILFIWAGFWAGSCKDERDNSMVTTMQSLINEAKRQQPTLPALSFADEVQDLSTAINSPVEIVTDGESSTVLPKRKH